MSRIAVINFINALIIVLLSAVIIAAQPVKPAQKELSKDPAARLKVGLVLSGGGARGFAHIGVLRWFEEHHIPIDYITGTSIGGLIGGLYATGRTADEIEQLLGDIDWPLLLEQTTAYENLSFRRKEDRSNFKTGYEINIGRRSSLPAGLSSAHYIGLLLDRWTLPYSNLQNFDQLPIPFRAMATDFLTAKSVVLKDGPLSTAMRATMSIPGVFPPVERDGRVLVDGGLLDNIPTVAMKDLKPDIIIVVDIGTQLGDIESIKSITGILQQAVTVMTIQNDRRNLRLADIVIAPEIGDKSILDFTGVSDTIALGYRAASEKANLLDRFAVDEDRWQSYLDRRNAKKRPDEITPQAIEVVGVDSRTENIIKDRLRSYLYQQLDLPELESELTEIVGEGKYDSIGYQILPALRSPQESALVLQVKERSPALKTLNLGLEIEGSDVNDINFTLGGRLTFYDFGSFGSEQRIDVRLGFHTLFAGEYFKPLDNNRQLFIAPRVFFQREREGLYIKNARIAEYQTNVAGFGADLVLLKKISELRFGFEINRTSANVRSGDPVLPKISGMASLVRLRWAYDSQNSATVPTRGLKLMAEGRYFFTAPFVQGSRSFPQVSLRLTNFRPINERSTLVLGFAGGTTFNKDAGFVQQFRLGGPFELNAYELGEFRGNHLLFGTIGYMRQISEFNSILGGKIYGIGLYQVGNAFPVITAPKVNNAFSLGVIVDTKLGPFSIIGGLGEGGRGKIYFSYGRFF